MDRIAAIRLFGVLWIAALLCVPASAGDLAATEDPDRERAYRILDAAKAKRGTDVRAQAYALVEHAWPDDDPDPWVAAMARDQLTRFGVPGLQALRDAIQTVQPRYQFDVVSTLIETNARISGGHPPEYLPAIEDAIWHGSLEAKRIAIAEAARYRYPLALLTTEDAAYEHPELMAVAVEALGDFRHPRAGRFLKEVMQRGLPYERLLAARSLGRIGGDAMDTLREAARDDDAGCRTAAMATLLPATGTADLSLLHEYVGLHADDDPSLGRLVLKRAQLLESILEARMNADAASID